MFLVFLVLLLLFAVWRASHARFTITDYREDEIKE